MLWPVRRGAHLKLIAGFLVAASLAGFTLGQRLGHHPAQAVAHTPATHLRTAGGNVGGAPAAVSLPSAGAKAPAAPPLVVPVSDHGSRGDGHGAKHDHHNGSGHHDNPFAGSSTDGNSGD
jgi:hypothetical protein